MDPPPVSLLVFLALALLAAGPSRVHAEGSSGQGPSHRNMTREGHDNQCSSLQRRQDLMDGRLNGVQNSLNERDTRLNRIDKRLDDIETVMSDLKEYLRRRMSSIEEKAEWALANTNHKVTSEKTQVGTGDYRPPRITQVHRGCKEAHRLGWTTSGLYRVAPEPGAQIDVYCEQELYGGGWTVFQARKDGSVNFFEDWNSYKTGFGYLTGEFWLGNDNIHLMTKQHDQQLKIELTGPEGEVKYVDYNVFFVANETNKYRLMVAGYTGESPPGDSFGFQDGQPFSTKDQDRNDCAAKYLGGWWYKACHASNLNGLYGSEVYGKGVVWYHWTGHHKSMNATRMMMRTKS